MKTEVLTQEELRNLIQKKDSSNLDIKIHYFHYSDLDSCFCTQGYLDHLKFIVSYNRNEIMGICKFAYYDLNKEYAMSYISTHEDYRNKGAAKSMIKELFKFFKNNYPDQTLGLSGYSIDGWKYIRKYILSFSKKFQTPINEKPIQYITNWNAENRKLFDESREIIK
jgi:hypothetical protein